VVRRNPKPDASLAEILGGRSGALEATVPVVAFVAVFTLVDAAAWAWPVAWAGGAAVLAAAAVGGVRLAGGGRPRAVLFGLLGVAVAALVALYTGRASALAWAVSIVIRWPLLGLAVGMVLGQNTRWRRDPHLLRGYQRASWVWVGQYLVRVAVFLPLYFANAVLALGVARSMLTWPLVALCVTLSWPVLRSALPPGHHGLRHPAEEPPGSHPST
jgi:hypothetical protein